MQDEKIVADARFHGFYTCWAFVIFAFCLALGGGVQYAAWHYLGQWPFAPLYAGAAVGAWILFAMMLKKWTTEIILTDRRLLYKRGFFKINIDEVDIEQLASDYVEQSLLGRILDYGEIHIRCIEASDVWLPPVAQPYEFRNQLEKMKHAYREQYMGVGRLYRHGSHGQNGNYKQAQ